VLNKSVGFILCMFWHMSFHIRNDLSINVFFKKNTGRTTLLYLARPQNIEF
jgi:hypothetical protein